MSYELRVRRKKKEQKRKTYTLKSGTGNVIGDPLKEVQGDGGGKPQISGARPGFSGSEESVSRNNEDQFLGEARRELRKENSGDLTACFEVF